MGLAFYAYSPPFSSLVFPFFLPSLHSVCMRWLMSGYGSAGKFSFCHYLWNSWDRGLNVFSVATTKCTGLIKCCSNFGLLFCLTCQLF